MPDFSSANASILIADDNDLNLDLLSEILTSEGYSVTCVKSGDAAVASAQSGLVDLVLLDVIMPGTTGFSACQQIKLNPKTRLIPVILITGLTDTNDRIHGIMCGADDLLNKPVNKQELLARVHSLLRLKSFTDELENAETVLFSLATSIEAKDPYTEGHCERLSEYSVALAERIGLPEDLRIALRRGGVVHDVGKVAVPEHILLKPGPLTDEEWVIMRQHPIVGEKICSRLKSFRLVVPIIRYHHEKLNGSGYPDGLIGDEIPITAKVLQIVDVYDALTTDRPYRKALSPGETLVQMRSEVKRGWWDGALVDELEGIVSELEVPIAGSGSKNSRVKTLR